MGGRGESRRVKREGKSERVKGEGKSESEEVRGEWVWGKEEES